MTRGGRRSAAAAAATLETTKEARGQTSRQQLLARRLEFQAPVEAERGVGGRGRAGTRVAARTDRPRHIQPEPPCLARETSRAASTSLLPIPCDRYSGLTYISSMTPYSPPA